MKVIQTTVIIAVIIVLAGCHSRDSLIKQLSSFNWIKSPPQTNLKGRVTDKLSSRSIAGATVFLANTTFITQTDSSGNFFLEKVPYGKYEIYVIEPFSKPVKETISIYGVVRNLFEIKIEHESNKTSFNNQSINEAKKTIVDKQKDRLNRLNEILFNPGLDKFNEIIIGKDNKCKLLNPEALNIVLPQKGGPETVTFTANEPLYIINKHMGYELLVVLEKASITNVQSYYYMKFNAAVAFKELPPLDTNEMDGWIRNRVDAFTGSQSHFLAALIHNKLEESGFTLFVSPSSTTNISIGIPGSHSVEQARPIPVYDLYDYLKPTNYDFEFELSYPEILKVNHLFKLPDYEKNKFYGSTSSISTLISLQNKPVIINCIGTIKNGVIYKTGYWALQQLSDLIPEDYFPQPTLKGFLPSTETNSAFLRKR